MRISDWSSDVCSSDLIISSKGELLWQLFPVMVYFRTHVSVQAIWRSRRLSTMPRPVHSVSRTSARLALTSCSTARPSPRRSEELTSQLQSPMRSPHDVFCLQTTNKTLHTHTVRRY